MKRLSIIAFISLSACQSGPSHIPPLHQIPGAAIGSAIENTLYSSRRKKVKNSIAPHLDTILAEADKGGGAAFNQSCKIANITPPRCAVLAREISQDTHIYGVGPVDEKLEKLTVAFMVYAN